MPRNSGSVRPTRVRIGASTVCRLACPACPNPEGRIADTLGEGYLTARDLEGVLDSSPWVREVEVSGWGEPFINPEMPAIVEAASVRGVRLTADNGSTLNGVSDELARALVTHRFRRITCSIDGACQATYSVYRRGGDFDRVVETVRKLNALKAELRSPYPRLTWQFVVFGHNEHEVPAARKLAAELRMVFRLKESWDPHFDEVRDERAVASQHRRVGTFRHALKLREPDRMARAFCHQLWEEPQINWDGRVLGCCCNHTAAFDGNAFRDGLSEAINTDSMKWARLMLVGATPQKADVPCSSCDVFHVMRSTGRYLRRGLTRRVFRVGRFLYNNMRLRELLQRGMVVSLAS